MCHNIPGALDLNSHSLVVAVALGGICPSTAFVLVVPEVFAGLCTASVSESITGPASPMVVARYAERSILSLGSEGTRLQSGDSFLAAMISKYKADYGLLRSCQNGHLYSGAIQPRIEFKLMLDNDRSD